MSHPQSAASAAVTTRSRTLLFLSYRDSKARSHRFRRSSTYEPDDADQDSSSEHARLISAPGPAASSSSTHVALDVAQLPPEWVDVSDRVAQLLADAESKIARLEKLHAKHVLPGFADRSQEERDIDALTSAITRDFRHASKLVHQIQTAPSASTYPPHRSEDTAAKNVQRALAARVQDASTAFRKKQRVYMDKLAGHATKNQDLLVASGLRGDAAAQSRLSVEEDLHESQSLQQLQHDPALATRNAEIAHLAQSIAGLAELFKDLSSLVVEQGTILDSVEYNIEQAAVELDHANAELKVAQRYQRNTGRRSCIFLLILLIVGTILVIIFKPRRPHSVPAVPPPVASSALQ
ncbi:t-SNARE [Auricularia subglabra TFB-10046 SS5]|nr:t-SNARE [Auricularia subglabra TFB-10046 SS5]